MCRLGSARLVSRGLGAGWGRARGWATSPGREEPPLPSAARLSTARQYRLQGWMTSQGGSHPLLRGDTGLSEAKLLRGRGPGMAGERLGECRAVGVPTPATHPCQPCLGARAGVGGWEGGPGSRGEGRGFGGLWPELRLC